MSEAPGREPRTSVDRPTTDDRHTAFAAFYRHTTKPLVAFLIHQGATLQEAADLTQDTMAKALQNWDTIHSPRAWVHRVAGRALIHLRVETRETPTEPLPPSPLLRADTTPGWELGIDLVRALRELPPRQQQVMAWTLAGHAPTEIATELDLSADTVRQHLMRARRTLAARLTAKEPPR